MSIREIEEFNIIISSAIDYGNVNSLVKAINDYENKLPINYIMCAKNILYELLIEKIDSLVME
jgi:predicted DNA-binding protein YlxM (UPF0122 family)